MRVLSVCSPTVRVLVYRALMRNDNTIDEFNDSYYAHRSLQSDPAYDLLIVTREVPTYRSTIIGGGLLASSLYDKFFLDTCVDLMGNRQMPPVIILDTLQSTPADPSKYPGWNVTVVPWPTTEDDLLAVIRRIQNEIGQGK